MTNKADQKILYDSPEAATFRTGLSGWVSSQGLYYGKDEHLARWAGCTHIKCECGHIHEKTWTCCEVCRAKHERESYFKLTEIPFNQVEVCCIYHDDKYFFGEDDIEQYMEDNDIQPEDLMLQVCEAKTTLPRVNEDYWADDLPEDHDLPPEIQDALDALNKAIKDHSPTVWWGVSKRTTYKLQPS